VKKEPSLVTEYPGSEPRPPAAPARFGRRSLLRGAGAALLTGPLLAACGGQDGVAGDPNDHSDTEKVLSVAVQPGFLDKKPPTGTVKPIRVTTVRQFSAGSGITVQWHEDIGNDEQFLAKAAANFKAGKWMGFDLVILPSWLAAHAVTAKLAQKLDHTSMVNIRNVAAPFQSSRADPQRDYTVPWAGGITGIAYDSEAVSRPVRTVTDLLTRPSLKGKVTALTSLRDTLGLIIAQSGADPDAATSSDVSAALGTLEKAVKAKQFLRFTGPEYVGDLISGRAVASIASSLDLPKLKAANPAIEFVVPEAGGMLWTRDAFVPGGARHRSNAESFLSAYYDPKFAARFAVGLQHVCTVSGAREEVGEVQPSLMSNPLVFPDAAMLARLSMFVQVDEKTSAAYATAFQGVIDGKTS
jgi:spermidine/putrescine transport system substrate-binding protein